MLSDVVSPLSFSLTPFLLVWSFEVSKLVSRQYIFNPCTALQMKKRTVHVLNVRVMFQFSTADSTVSHDPYCMRSSLFLITTTSGESKVSVGVPWITDPIISIRIVLPFQHSITVLNTCIQCETETITCRSDLTIRQEGIHSCWSIAVHKSIALCFSASIFVPWSSNLWAGNITEGSLF